MKTVSIGLLKRDGFGQRNYNRGIIQIIHKVYIQQNTGNLKLTLPKSSFHSPLCVLTGSVNIVRICEANASTARELKVAPFSNEYQKFLAGSSMTKFTTNSAYSTRNQVMVAHTIPQLSCMNHSVRFPTVWPVWGPPTITPPARPPVSTSALADSSGWCCSISRSRWFEECIVPYGQKTHHSQ